MSLPYDWPGEWSKAAATAATATLWNTARAAQNHHLESLLREMNNG